MIDDFEFKGVGFEPHLDAMLLVASAANLALSSKSWFISGSLFCENRFKEFTALDPLELPGGGSAVIPVIAKSDIVISN